MQIAARLWIELLFLSWKWDTTWIWAQSFAILTRGGPMIMPVQWVRVMSSSFSRPHEIVPSLTPFWPCSNSSRRRKFRGTTAKKTHKHSQRTKTDSISIYFSFEYFIRHLHIIAAYNGWQHTNWHWKLCLLYTKKKRRGKSHFKWEKQNFWPKSHNIWQY